MRSVSRQSQISLQQVYRGATHRMLCTLSYHKLDLMPKRIFGQIAESYLYDRLTTILWSVAIFRDVFHSLGKTVYMLLLELTELRECVHT